MDDAHKIVGTIKYDKLNDIIETLVLGFFVTESVETNIKSNRKW